MLQRQNRFRGLGSVRPALKYGQSVRADGMRLKYLQNNKQSQPRLAVMVSKKVSKKAVVRNRIRRRLFHAARPHIEAIQEPWDFVVSVYDINYSDRPWPEVERETAKLFERFTDNN